MIKIKSLINKIFSLLQRKKIIYANINVLPQTELLKGRVSLVTGGTSGIGLAIAKAFVKAGSTVIITGRDQERIEAAIGEIEKEHSENQVFGIKLDNTNIKQMKTQLQNIISEVNQIDVLVNNAGVNGGRIDNVEEEEFDKIIDTNLKGTFFLTKYISKHMIENNIEGNILNIVSAASIRPAISAYQVSKWGIRGLTQGLARALAPHGIVVNGIAPGPTATPMLIKNDDANIAHPRNLLGRYAMPEEIANMAVILTSNLGRTIIGDTIFMSGGGGIITNEDVDYNI